MPCTHTYPFKQPILANVILLPFMTQMITPVEDHLNCFHPRMNICMRSELKTVDKVWVPKPTWVEVWPAEITPPFAEFFDARLDVFVALRFLHNQTFLQSFECRIGIHYERLVHSRSFEELRVSGESQYFMDYAFEKA